ncbi:MAG: hypothetical protein ABEJ76_07815 [Halanaeroarchaeum sp.]
MTSRYDAFGDAAVFAKAATGLAVAGVVLLVAGIAVASPLTTSVPPATLAGLLTTGTGGGFVLGAAVTLLTAGAVSDSE